MKPTDLKSEPIQPILTQPPKLDPIQRVGPDDGEEAGPTKETDVKIDNNTIKNLSPTRGKESKSVIGKLLQPAEPPSVSDEVKLTSTSEKLLQLENELSNIDVTDTAKVESVRKAIDDGSFKVDEEAVAEGLIEESINNIGQRTRQ